MKEVLENKDKDRVTAQHLAERYRYEFVDLKDLRQSILVSASSPNLQL